MGDGNWSNVFRGGSTADEVLWRSANDGSVQGFAGRALPSPVNQDGWLNLQRSRNNHKTNGGDRFYLEYNQSSPPACSSALLKLRSLLEYHVSLPEWVVYRVFCNETVTAARYRFAGFVKPGYCLGTWRWLAGWPMRICYWWGQQSCRCLSRYLWEGRDIFRYLLERRGWGCRPLQCNWKLAYWIPRFITRRCLWLACRVLQLVIAWATISNGTNSRKASTS